MLLQPKYELMFCISARFRTRTSFSSFPISVFNVVHVQISNEVGGGSHASKGPSKGTFVGKHRNDRSEAIFGMIWGNFVDENALNTKIIKQILA